MSQYEAELKRARDYLTAAGRDSVGFSFAMAYQPPDPDGGGMFTVRYDVTVTNQANGKSVVVTGGNELDWVAELAYRLDQGRLG